MAVDSSTLACHLPKVNVPEHFSQIYKDECMFSFDTPLTDTGLYVCLSTFFGLGADYLEQHYRKTASRVYLHIKHEKVPIKQEDTENEKQVTRLAIGVEGGFDVNAKKFDIKEHCSIVVYPENIVYQWPDESLPQKVIASVTGILKAVSATHVAELQVGAWDGEVRCVSKYATSLLQLNNNKKIPPGNWKCEECELTTNLWLNLTDGSIHCGRKFFDGSGGNNHAIEHYCKTKYPLAVKLGTITKDGKADVYSYEEDDMVEDPELTKHLAHFGINIANLEVTDKSMVELELDLNKKLGEWTAIQESGSKLQPLYGSGYTGLNNLGNSCYMNSLMQVLFNVPSFVERYVSNATAIFNSVMGNPAEDFNAQMAKLGTGLLSGKYSRPPENEYDNTFSVSPRMFRTLVGKGSPVFSTKHQQDVQEFYLHILTLLQRNLHGQSDPADWFKIRVEDRFQCSASNKVKYTYRTEYCLPIPIPVEAAINKSEVEEFERKRSDPNYKSDGEIVRPRIIFDSCISAFMEQDAVEQFYSSALNAKTTAYKATRIGCFPKVLVFHLKKFTLREDWTPMKLDVSVDMPDTIDLTKVKAFGVQPGEELLPDESGDGVKVSTFAYNDSILNTLADMGFQMHACKRACFETKNAGLEEATNWIMENLDNPAINDPFVLPGETSNFVPDEAALTTVMSFGFTRKHAVKALRETDNNVERAADWVFNHPDLEDDDIEDIAITTSTSHHTAEKDLESPEEPAKYHLKAFISHMGTSTAAGHYVCHINIDNRWVIFNDEKVALSEKPPKDLGYIYFYERY